MSSQNSFRDIFSSGILSNSNKNYNNNTKYDFKNEKSYDYDKDLNEEMQTKTVFLDRASLRRKREKSFSSKEEEDNYEWQQTFKDISKLNLPFGFLLYFFKCFLF